MVVLLAVRASRCIAAVIGSALDELAMLLAHVVTHDAEVKDGGELGCEKRGQRDRRDERQRQPLGSAR